jgi:hypothetical protein
MNATTTLITLRNESLSCWSTCVCTAGIVDCGENHDEEREAEAWDDAQEAEEAWDNAIEAYEEGDTPTALIHMDTASQLAEKWGDDSIEAQAIEILKES